MPKGSNCAIVQEYKPNFKWGVFKTEYCYKFANAMLGIHYIGDIREWQ